MRDGSRENWHLGEWPESGDTCPEWEWYPPTGWVPREHKESAMVEACKLQAPSSWADAYVTTASHRPSRFSRFTVHTSHCLELARVASWSWSGDLKTKWVGKRARGTATVSWERRCMESGHHARVPCTCIQRDTEISGPGLTPHSCRQWKMCTCTQGLAFPRQISGNLGPSVLDRGVSQDHDFQS